MLYEQYKNKAAPPDPDIRDEAGRFKPNPSINVSPNHQGYSPILKPAYLTPVYGH